MSEELLKAIEDFKFEDTNLDPMWRIHYDPNNNGFITQITIASASTSTDPYIEVDEMTGKNFVAGRLYQREYHVIDGKLERRKMILDVFEASDKKVNQISIDDEITPGTYFITVKGDADLIIDTIAVTQDNLQSETERIKEYLENNDCFKDL
tara:strand:- start:1244 stop:1699 length:456 start_codon:yes stop_codon:yes gene_type:complete